MMITHTQKAPTGTVLIAIMATVLVAAITALVVAQPGQWREVLASPFLNPKAVKVMISLATLIVLFGGTATVFVAHLRATIFHVCGSLLVFTYAIGLTVTLI